MFKFCNKCYLCQKYYNDDDKCSPTFKYTYEIVSKFINADYEVIHRSDELLTENYIFTAHDKGLPSWHLYKDEFIYSCSGSILKGIEGSTSSWNGCSDNNRLSSYFITNYGKVLYIEFLNHLNKFNILVKHPALKGRGETLCYSPINYSDILLNKQKINQDTLNNINYLYEIPGLFIYNNNNAKFNIDIIYTVIHTCKTSNLITKENIQLENYNLLFEEFKNDNEELGTKYEKLKEKYNDLYDLYNDNVNTLKKLQENTNQITTNQVTTNQINTSEVVNLSAVAAQNRQLSFNIKNRLKRAIKCENNDNIFLNPSTWN